MNRRWILIISLFLLLPGAVNAQDSSSTNYELEESGFNSGGSLDSSSANYEARTSAGEQGVGNSGSTNYQVDGGSINPNEERLELDVTGTTLDFGVIDVNDTKSGNATFNVLAYYANGYNVQIVGDPPTNGNYVLDTPTTPTTSAQGTEQFGINLTSNTDPANFGSDPVQVPDSTFSFGQVDNDYNNTDQYMYLNGDRVAYSDQESGQTDYTISFIMNVDNLTAGGIYEGNYVLVATGNY